MCPIKKNKRKDGPTGERICVRFTLVANQEFSFFQSKQQIKSVIIDPPCGTNTIPSHESRLDFTPTPNRSISCPLLKIKIKVGSDARERETDRVSSKLIIKNHTFIDLGTKRKEKIPSFYRLYLFASFLV